jgi:hypothetical protein
MIVVAHQAIRVNTPAHSLAHLTQAVYKRLRRPGCFEQVAAVISAVQNMITSPGELDAWFSRHRPTRSALLTNINHKG